MAVCGECGGDDTKGPKMYKKDVYCCATGRVTCPGHHRVPGTNQILKCCVNCVPGYPGQMAHHACSGNGTKTVNQVCTSTHNRTPTQSRPGSRGSGR